MKYSYRTQRGKSEPIRLQAGDEVSLLARRGEKDESLVQITRGTESIFWCQEGQQPSQAEIVRPAICADQFLILLRALASAHSLDFRRAQPKEGALVSYVLID